MKSPGEKVELLSSGLFLNGGTMELKYSFENSYT